MHDEPIKNILDINDQWNIIFVKQFMHCSNKKIIYSRLKMTHGITQ